MNKKKIFGGRMMKNINFDQFLTIISDPKQSLFSSEMFRHEKLFLATGNLFEDRESRISFRPDDFDSFDINQS